MSPECTQFLDPKQGVAAGPKLSNMISAGREVAQDRANGAAAKTHKQCSVTKFDSAPCRKNRDLSRDLQARGMVACRAARSPPTQARRSLLGLRRGYFRSTTRVEYVGPPGAVSSRGAATSARRGRGTVRADLEPMAEFARVAAARW